MAAAAITPTWVKKRYLPSTTTYGTTTDKLVEYIVKLTTVTTGDWFVAATYTPGTIIGASSIEYATDATTGTISYTTSGTKLVITDASTVGTCYVRVLCIE